MTTIKTTKREKETKEEKTNAENVEQKKLHRNVWAFCNPGTTLSLICCLTKNTRKNQF